jgi:signal transduction histidine kinase
MPEIYFELARSLPEPMLLVSHKGMILASNPPAETAFQARVGACVQDLNWNSPEKIADFLRVCSATRQPMPAAFSFQSGLRVIDYRAEGHLVRPTAGEDCGLLLLRFQLREQANRTFLELNEKINGLSTEIRKRMQAEQELRKSQAALEEANRQLQLNSSKLETLVAERTCKLEESLQSMELFCYSMAHDLRAPLRAISGFTQALLEDHEELFGEPGRDCARRIMGATVRMDRLISDLLSYAKFSQGELPPTELPLEIIVEHALAVLAVEIKKKKAEIRVSRPLASLRANEVALEKILLNLLSNALKFAAESTPPRIEIETIEKGDWIRCCIRDNGIGIAEPHQQKVFGLFERLHREDQYPGTGIGLALASKCVERLGGKIGVESVLGQGSCFWFELKASSNASPDRSAAAGDPLSKVEIRRSDTGQSPL